MAAGADAVIPLPDGSIIGGREVIVMAGPCSVESEEQILARGPRR